MLQDGILLIKKKKRQSLLAETTDPHWHWNGKNYQNVFILHFKL